MCRPGPKAGLPAGVPLGSVRYRVMPDFQWDELIDCLMQGNGNVVPIVGSELLDLPGPTPGGPMVPFSQRLATECAPLLAAEFERLAIPLPVGPAASLEEQRGLSRAARVLSPDFERGGGFPRMLKAAHDRLLESLAPGDMPAPLRLLLEMRDWFPFIVCTTTDGLVARAFELGRDQVRSSLPPSCVDLDPGWKPGDNPRLFHLFGRIDAAGDTVLSDEDRLEYLSHLQYEGRPNRLLSHLRASHLLFLGQRLPDYLALVFLRLMRGERFGGEGKRALEAIVDSGMRQGAPLVGFLRQYAARTRIFEDGGSAAFVREMHRRWCEAREAQAAPAAAGETEPQDMPRPAIFLSYSNRNHAAAEALANALRSHHLPVWMDRWQLEGGDRFAPKILRHVRHCRLFVPLLSHGTEGRNGWFRREWVVVQDLLKEKSPSQTWVIPVLVDDLDPYASKDMENYFSPLGNALHALRCPDGALNGDDLDFFVSKYREAEKAAKSP